MAVSPGLPSSAVPATGVAPLQKTGFIHFLGCARPDSDSREKKGRKGTVTLLGEALGADGQSECEDWMSFQTISLLKPFFHPLGNLCHSKPLFFPSPCNNNPENLCKATLAFPG